MYLKLDEPLSEGRRYTLSFRGKKVDPFDFTFDPTRLRSEAVHVSHVGFHPEDPVKVVSRSTKQMPFPKGSLM